MQKAISRKIISYLPQIIALLFIAGFAAYAAVWKEPTQVPPGGNVDTPINVGTDPQAKASRISATEFYDYNDPNYYLNPSGSSKLSAVTVVGGTSLPACDSSYRGKIYLLQSGSGTEDGLYVCKKKADDSYDWVAAASPPRKLMTQANTSDCNKYYRLLDQTGETPYQCKSDDFNCTSMTGICYSGGLKVAKESTGEIRAWGTELNMRQSYGYNNSGRTSTYCGCTSLYWGGGEGNNWTTARLWP